jgi:hypothetical protein
MKRCPKLQYESEAEIFRLSVVLSVSSPLTSLKTHNVRLSGVATPRGQSAKLLHFIFFFLSILLFFSFLFFGAIGL